VTIPAALTLAIVGELEDQTPPDVASAKVEVRPRQTDVIPVIAATLALGLTVTEVVAVAEPQVETTL
jgi:hypothetical protein